jgi:hypothetical protein
MRYASAASLTVGSISVIPGRHRGSAAADGCIIVPISGRPEIGCGEPGIHNLKPVVVDTGPVAELVIKPAEGQARWFGPRHDSRKC